MSKIAILTDSSCDIPQEMAEKYGIDIMSFHILLDDVDYVERVDCTNTEFYDKMRAAKGVPSTAAITPIQFCEKYCQYVDEGYTDVIHVPINKSGSSTYNNALMAQGMLREERPEHHLKIHLIDSHTYSMPFGWYLCEMARKLQNGAEISHVIQEFETQMDKMEIVLGPYSLKQMKKSGRISAAAAVMGELMGIRPIITLIDGKTKVEAKVRVLLDKHVLGGKDGLFRRLFIKERRQGAAQALQHVRQRGDGGGGQVPLHLGDEPLAQLAPVRQLLLGQSPLQPQLAQLFSDIQAETASFFSGRGGLLSLNRRSHAQV